MLNLAQIAKAAYSICPSDRMTLRRLFLSEVRSTQPPPTPLGPIYAGLLPQAIGPVRDPLKWLQQVTPAGAQPVSDGVLLYNRWVRGGRTLVGIFTDAPAGVYTPDLRHSRPLPVAPTPDLIAEQYPHAVSRSILDVVWFDPRGETPLYEITEGTYVKQWNWAVCAGTQTAQVAVEPDCVKLKIDHPRGLRFARIPLHTPPQGRDEYVDILARAAQLPKPGSEAPARPPVRSTVRRYLDTHIPHLGLSDELTIRLYRYFRGY